MINWTSKLLKNCELIKFALSSNKLSNQIISASQSLNIWKTDRLSKNPIQIAKKKCLVKITTLDNNTFYHQWHVISGKNFADLTTTGDLHISNKTFLVKFIVTSCFQLIWELLGVTKRVLCNVIFKNVWVSAWFKITV